MLFKARTGVSWRDLPERYGPWKTVYSRFWRWSRNGTLTMLVAKVRVMVEAIDELDREVSVDSGIVRAHQHGAGACRRMPAHTGGGASRVAGRLNRMIRLSAGPGAAPRPRSISPAMGTADH
ncbi:putative transposase of IS4/5 family (DUF4096) [Lentzea flava]|nr:putative transposase of IS4/5 family (DUF4096) [Lentzea flava]